MNMIPETRRLEDSSRDSLQCLTGEEELKRLIDHLSSCFGCRSKLVSALSSASPESPAESERPNPPDHLNPISIKNEGRSSDERLDLLITAIARLQAAFDEKIRFDAGREAVIDRLHAELQEYRADLALKILRPLALEVIGFQDDLGRMIAARQPEDPAVTILDGLRQDIDDVLYRSGFEVFTTDHAEFDPRRQKVGRPIPTTDPSRDRRVAERLRKGFLYQGLVIRPEVVNVYVASASVSG
jgi:molecular chaperone GrpE